VSNQPWVHGKDVVEPLHHPRGAFTFRHVNSEGGEKVFLRAPPKCARNECAGAKFKCGNVPRLTAIGIEDKVDYFVDEFLSQMRDSSGHCWGWNGMVADVNIMHEESQCPFNYFLGRGHCL